MNKALTLGFAAALFAFAPAAEARVDVTLDTATLNDLLGKMAPERVSVSLGGGRSLELRLGDLRINGFEPAAGDRGHLLSSLQLSIPELGVNVPVAPRLSLQFKEANGRKVAYLRFEEVKLPLPMTGTVDIAPLLPPLPITTDTSWKVAAHRGPMRVEPRLVDATMGQKNLKLTFDLVVTPE
ncbi:MAG TPA: hypothetical protein VF139_10930 [Candidatus Polarisedimenticolaceae bacterium]